MKKSVWVGDLAWAGYLLVLAVFFGLVQHWPMVCLAWRGELPAYLAKVRESRRLVRFQGVKTVNLAQALALYEKGQALFVDAREPDEYAELHIKGAINLPPGDWEALDKPPWTEIPKDRPLVVYCGSKACDNALKVAEKLQALGFARVEAYLGGFRSWDEAGYPVDTLL
ncbi:MAG: rhodanese-like domain-containing protein [Deltaproteobacteria bacterium]|nr:rhodanese-like domain-containing protein [Deltaproteobacteria bacterium]